MTKKLLLLSNIILTLAVAAPVFAETASSTPKMSKSAVSAATIACVGAAVNTREIALDAGVSTHASAVSSAYSTRATALQQAYTGTSTAQIRTAVKAAWKTFNASLKSAAKAWRATRSSAWSAFRGSVKACKAPGSIGDSENASSETNGD